MKKLELNNLEVQELNTTEMTNVEGGGLLDGLLGGVGGGLLGGLGLGNLTGSLGVVTTPVKTILNDTFSFLNKQLSNVQSLVNGL
ncbi:hypothetical protein [Pedobacter africanus]|uniref:Bacteriocin-type signal sequence-containing protein n=1 Tax=Pedobacter africanus TaxID=151894 RepID=A0A1W1ZRY3_9SPHI|nr:hypothetical protein [Pedobacter africanus]SMC51285.1 hypothetical protein SAMN04488524_0947 [Pedobacter africanus]